jgi:hypothetical protein
MAKWGHLGDGAMCCNAALELMRVDFRNGENYHFDAFGSIYQMTDSVQNVVKDYDYSAFGKIISEAGSLANPFSYTAREFDEDSGLSGRGIMTQKWGGFWGENHSLGMWPMHFRQGFKRGFCRAYWQTYISMSLTIRLIWWILSGISISGGLGGFLGESWRFKKGSPIKGPPVK